MGATAAHNSSKKQHGYVCMQLATTIFKLRHLIPSYICFNITIIFEIYLKHKIWLVNSGSFANVNLPKSSPPPTKVSLNMVSDKSILKVGLMFYTVYKDYVYENLVNLLCLWENLKVLIFNKSISQYFP